MIMYVAFKKGKVHLYSALIAPIRCLCSVIVTDTEGQDKQPSPQPKPAVTDFCL